MRNPLIPMLAVTGTPDKGKIRNFLESLYNVGLQQFLIYPRSGCEIEYMSEEWFRTVHDFLKCAEELNMKVWLYDDYNWPSGHCGGRVVQNPDNRLKSLTIRGADAGKIHTGNNTDDFFGLGRFPDLMSEAATDCFITSTHEAYYKHFSQYFGNVILGIFTDEPSIAYACGQDDVPYYAGMEDDYIQKTGRALYDDIQNQHEQLQTACMDIVMARFKKCYIQKLVRWCKEHGIQMTGHLLHDDSPYRSARNSGGLLSCLSSFDIPGIDEIYSDITSEYELTLLGAVQYAAKNHAMAEMFALGPCDMPYAKKRCMLYMAGCFRIDHYFIAISPLDVRASKIIPDFFNTFSELQPDFAGMKLLAADAIQAATYAKKDFIPDVWICYPRSAYVQDILTVKSDQPIYNLVNSLTRHQIQWKFVQEDETPGSNAPVVSFDTELNILLNGDRATVADVCQKCMPKLLVTNRDGSLPEHLFVRRFNDGSRLVLDLAGKKRELLDGERAFSMYAFDVWEGEHQALKMEKHSFDGSFEVQYHNENVIRALFVDEQIHATVICNAPMTVSFAVREQVQCFLDGILCEHTAEEKTLGTGMKEFYHSTTQYMLDKGTHLLRSGDDYKYLPSVLLKGNFHAKTLSEPDCAVKLEQAKQVYFPGEKLQYYGTVSFTKKIVLPAMVDEIEITGTRLYTTVYLDNQYLGSAIYAPYRYHIEPVAHERTCVLKIVQKSSIGPIFGDVAYFDAHKKQVSWRGTPSTGETFFGFEKVCY